MLLQQGCLSPEGSTLRDGRAFGDGSVLHSLDQEALTEWSHVRDGEQTPVFCPRPLTHKVGSRERGSRL